MKENNPYNINEIKKIEISNEEKDILKENEDDPLLLEFNIPNKKEEGKFNPEINYLTLNPFKNYAKAGLGLTIGGFTGIIVAYSPFILPGLITSGIGGIILIPSFIGFILYKLFKKNKNEKYKIFLESLNNNNMREEKEILEEISSKYKNEINSLFYNDFNMEYNLEISDKINKYINIFIKTMEAESDRLLLKNQEEIKGISNLNVILLGQTGVGKSALINGVLKLEKNKAEEQDNSEPKHINGWTKKYPINEEDTKLKNINLWDTEGIELSNDNKNNIKAHLKKVIQHINTHKSIPNEQINCLWYCINWKYFSKIRRKICKGTFNFI